MPSLWEAEGFMVDEKPGPFGCCAPCPREQPRSTAGAPTTTDPQPCSGGKFPPSRGGTWAFSPKQEPILTHWTLWFFCCPLPGWIKTMTMPLSNGHRNCNNQVSWLNRQVGIPFYSYPFYLLLLLIHVSKRYLSTFCISIHNNNQNSHITPFHCIKIGLKQTLFILWDT